LKFDFGCFVKKTADDSAIMLSLMVNIVDIC
jgi:hypothetical protein